MYDQLSGVVLVTLFIRTAITGLRAALQFSNSDKVFRVTPKRLAATYNVASDKSLVFLNFVARRRALTHPTSSPNTRR